VTEVPIEVLRVLFLHDLRSRPLASDTHTGSLLDRTGHSWTVFDIGGTWEAARQRAFPQNDDLPPPLLALQHVEIHPALACVIDRNISVYYTDVHN
jgi:hypothetical protein